MSHHPTTEELYDAHIKQVEGPRGLEIHSHLEQCAECRQVLMDYEQLESFYQNAALENPPPKSLDAIRLKARQVVEKPAQRFLWAFLRLDRAFGLAIVLAIVAGIGLLYRNHFQEQTEILQAPLPATAPIAQKIEPKPQKMEPAPSPGEMQDLPEAKSKGVLQTPSPPSPTSAFVKTEEVMGVGQAITGETQKMKKEAAKPAPDEERELVARQKEGRSQDAAGTTQRTVAVQPALTKMPSISPSDQLFDQALALHNKGNHREAAKIYQKIWKDEPWFFRREALLYNWALCLEKTGKKNEALKKLELLEKLNKSYPGLSEAKKRLKK